MSKKREIVGALLLVGCALLVAFWEIMSYRSKRQREALSVSAAQFSTFAPEFEGWKVRPLPVESDPLEPNIVGCLLSPAVVQVGAAKPTESPTFVRLVHGYNVVDCMRIKGYRVEPVADTRRSLGVGTVVTGNDQYQIWRLTADSGEVFPWISSMLNASDLEVTNLDTRSMAFPRVGTPDHPGWAPRGFTLSSLRHPIRNGRLFLRHKWNASRTDVMTFLGLRQPAWVSDELLTLVSTAVQPVGAEGEAVAIERVLAAHQAILNALQTWRRDAREPDRAGVEKTMDEKTLDQKTRRPEDQHPITNTQ